MLISRSARALVAQLAALLVMGACTGRDVTPVTEPAFGDGADRAVLQRVDDQATPARPTDAWMGASLTEVLRVRVIDATGSPIRGVSVRFLVAPDGARIGARGTSLDVPGDTMITTTSDADGIASAGEWMLPVRDTASAMHVASAQLVHGDPGMVRFAVKAWRDMSAFGGTQPLVLDRLPIERRRLAAILPLGTLRADDALPSADAMLVLRDSGSATVRAVADGVITELDAANGAVTMRVRDQIRVRIGGIRLRTDLWVGRVLNVGDMVGTFSASPHDAGIAVRVLDASVHRTRWVHPERYGARRNAVFVVSYLADSIRSDAYALVRRAAPDLEGRIDYDRVGRLVGTWFDAALPMTSPSGGPVSAPFVFSQYASTLASEVDPSASLAPVALTLAYDAERPGEVRIAVGSALAGALGFRGVRAVAWGDPDPAEVDVARGVVRYQLFRTDDEVRIGRAERVLLVQLLDENRVRAEVVSAADGEQAGFSFRAVTLIR